MFHHARKGHGGQTPVYIGIMPRLNPIRVISHDAVGTRLGRLRATGFVDDGPAIAARPRRITTSYMISFVYAGTGHYVDDTFQQRPVKPGDAIIVVPGHPHWFGPPPGATWSEIFVAFEGPIFATLAATGVFDVEDPVRPVASLEAWYERLRDFVERPRRPDPTGRELEILELTELLVAIRGAEDKEQTPSSIRHARQVLADDLTAKLNLNDVAADSGLSYETFRKLFRQTTGVSPGAYRLARRVEAAKTLLSTTTMTHTAIAAALGFADENHFAKRFRDRVGVSPKSYRKTSTAT